MVHLFATLPAEKLHGIPSKIVHTSRRLALEWQVSRPTHPHMKYGTGSMGQHPLSSIANMHDGLALRQHRLSITVRGVSLPSSLPRLGRCWEI